MSELKNVLANIIRGGTLPSKVSTNPVPPFNPNDDGYDLNRSPDPSTYQVNNINIRTNWLAGTSFEKRVVVKQAFLFIMAQTDYNLAVDNNFPHDMVGRLRDTLMNIRSIEFYNQLVKTDRYLLDKAQDKYTLKPTSVMMQVKDRYDESVDFVKLMVREEGIFFLDEDGTEEPWEFKLLNVEKQFLPMYPRLHKKLYKGTLGWYTKIGNIDCKCRLLMKIGGSVEESVNRAIYFSNIDSLNIIKDAFLSFDKKALSAKNMLKFMANRWKVQNSDYLFAKLYAFNIKSLNARNIDTKLIRMLSAEHEPIFSQKKITYNTDDEPDFIYPYIVMIPNISDNFVKIIQYEYSFVEDSSRELQSFAVDYYYQDVVDYDDTKYGVYTSRGEKIEMDDLIFSPAATFTLTIKTDYKTKTVQQFEIRKEDFLSKRHFTNLIMVQKDVVLINCLLIRNNKETIINEYRFISKCLFNDDSLSWRSLTPRTLSTVFNVLFQKDHVPLIKSNNVALILEENKHNQCLEIADRILYTSNMFRMFTTKYEINLVERFISKEFVNKLNKFCESQSRALNNMQGEFRNILASIAIGIPFESKASAFDLLLLQVNLDFIGTVPLFKTSADFYNFYIQALQKKLKISEKVKHFGMLSQQRYARKISTLYHYFNKNNSLMRLFFINPAFLTDGLDMKEINTGNRKFFLESFMKVYITKIFFKDKHPKIYSHLTVIGSSVEDLLLYHILTDFVDLYSLDMMMIIKDIKTNFTVYHSKSNIYNLIIDLLVVNIILVDCGSALLQCESSGDIFSAFQNICLNYGYSDHFNKTKKFTKRLMEGIFAFAEEKGTFIETDGGDVFENFSSLSHFYGTLQADISKIYDQIDFNYFNIGEVEKFFYEFKSKARRVDSVNQLVSQNSGGGVPKDSEIDDSGNNSMLDSRYAPLNNNISGLNMNKLEMLDIANFYPNHIIFNEIEESIKLIIKFKSINSLLLEKKNTISGDCIKIECNTGSVDKLISVYDIATGVFNQSTDLFEVPLRSAEQTLLFTLDYNGVTFVSMLPLSLRYMNCLETASLPFLNRNYGIIYLNILFTVHNKRANNLSQHMMFDISEEYCIDRAIGRQSVYKHPVIVEVNSLVQKYYIEYELRPKLKAEQAAKEIYQYALDEMQKYYSKENLTFPVVKIILYLALNAFDSGEEGLVHKLELLWDILTNFEHSSEFIQLETVQYLWEALIMNYLPFIPSFVSANIAERVFVGYSGNIVRATLLDESGEDLLDITTTLRQIVLQNQIYQNKRLINFLKEDLMIYLRGQIHQSLDDFNISEIKALKIVFFANNAVHRVKVKLKIKTEQSIDYIFNKRADSIVDLTNCLLIDKAVFMQMMQFDPLVVFLLHENFNSPFEEHMELPEYIPVKISDIDVFGVRTQKDKNKKYGHIGSNVLLINNNTFNPFSCD